MHYKPLSNGVSAALVCLALSAASVALSSCSTLSGKKMSPKAQPPDRNKANAVSGIPYTLNRPEFTLTIAKPAEGATHPTFSLSVEYVPDPSQHYTIAPSPGLFADPNFTLTMDDGTGAVTALTAKTTDQLSPTILAVGKFITAIAGVTAATMDAGKGGPNAVFSLLASSKEADALRTCQAPTDLPELWRMSIDEIHRSSSDAPLDVKRTNVQLALRVKSFSDEATLAARFHAITPGEYACISDLVADYRKSLEKRKELWSEFLANNYHGKTSFLNFDRDKIGSITTAVNEGDTDTLTAMLDEHQVPKPDETRLGLFRHKANELASIQRPDMDLLIATLNLKFESWKARQVGFLNGREERFQQLSITTTNAGTRSKDLKSAATIDKQLIATIDDSGLEQRKAELDRFMTRALSVNLDGRRIAAAQEFTQARTERDAVAKQIADLKAKYLLMLAPQSPSVPTPDPGTRTVDLCKIDAAGQLQSDVKPKPEFCVVLGSAP